MKHMTLESKDIIVYPLWAMDPQTQCFLHITPRCDKSKLEVCGASTTVAGLKALLDEDSHSVGPNLVLPACQSFLQTILETSFILVSS